jgi:hypothetical protein
MDDLIAQLDNTFDNTKLAEYVRCSFSSAREVLPLFDSLHSPSPALSRILSRALPPNFLNALSLSPCIDTAATYRSYCSPYQIFVLDLLRDRVKSAGPDDAFLNELAARLIPEFPASTVRCFGPLDSHRFGVWNSDGTVNIFRLPAVTPLGSEKVDLPETPTLAESLFQSRAIKALPLNAYSAIIDALVSPDLRLLSSCANVPDVEGSLVTIFLHAGCHRRLVKYCIYEEVTQCDANQVMRRNSPLVRIPIEFIRRNIEPIIVSVFNPLKVKLALSPSFDAKGVDDDNIAIVGAHLSSFITSMLGAASVIPSSIRFVCKCVHDAVAAHCGGVRFGKRGVFMLFLFRIVLPLLCQPQPTDSTDMPLDVQNMSKLSRVLTALFGSDPIAECAHLQTVIDALQPDVEKFYEMVTSCPEECDVPMRPTWGKVIEAVDTVREKCAVAIKEQRRRTRAPEILKFWLKSAEPQF